jgi:hypothetical protein
MDSEELVIPERLQRRAQEGQREKPGREENQNRFRAFFNFIDQPHSGASGRLDGNDRHLSFAQ